ncbi:hypothetical protein HanRHA438_Chr01g0003521 [Helianthus annuus]|nr:hypothetical protein HanRHA438_Chr01g0003521 [Helianthus annuus]
MLSFADRLFSKRHFIKKCLQTYVRPLPHADMVQCLSTSSNPLSTPLLLISKHITSLLHLTQTFSFKR